MFPRRDNSFRSRSHRGGSIRLWTECSGSEVEIGVAEVAEGMALLGSGQNSQRCCHQNVVVLPA